MGFLTYWSKEHKNIVAGYPGQNNALDFLWFIRHVFNKEGLVVNSIHSDLIASIKGPTVYTHYK